MMNPDAKYVQKCALHSSSCAKDRVTLGFQVTEDSLNMHLGTSDKLCVTEASGIAKNSRQRPYIYKYDILGC